jgi:hypothetical protein
VSTMAGESKEYLIERCVAFYPEEDRPEWARWYRGWTREALRRQRVMMEKHFASKKVTT